MCMHCRLHLSCFHSVAKTDNTGTKKELASGGGENKSGGRESQDYPSEAKESTEKSVVVGWKLHEKQKSALFLFGITRQV